MLRLRNRPRLSPSRTTSKKKLGTTTSLKKSVQNRSKPFLDAIAEMLAAQVVRELQSNPRPRLRLKNRATPRLRSPCRN